MEISAGAFFGGAAVAGVGIYAGREAYVQSQTATEYDYGAIGRAGAGGAVIGLATAVPGGSYLGLAASGVVSQAGDDLARGQMSSAGQYAFAAAAGPVLKAGFGALGRAFASEADGAGHAFGGRGYGPNITPAVRDRIARKTMQAANELGLEQQLARLDNLPPGGPSRRGFDPFFVRKRPRCRATRKMTPSRH